MKPSSHSYKPWGKKQEGCGLTEIWTRIAGFTSSETQGQSVGSAKVFKHRRKSPWARSSQPKFQPVRPGKVVHFKRWTRFFETFPVGPNRSNEFWTEISGNCQWLNGSRPLGTDFNQTISKRLSECWLLIGHKKMLRVIVPSRRLASPEFFSCVRTRRLLSRHTCPVRSPRLCVQFARETFTFYFPKQKRRSYRWLGKTFRMLSAGPFQFAPWKFCFWPITRYRKQYLRRPWST